MQRNAITDMINTSHNVQIPSAQCGFSSSAREVENHIPARWGWMRRALPVQLGQLGSASSRFWLITQRSLLNATLKGSLHLRALGAAAADQGFDLDLPPFKAIRSLGQHHPAGERPSALRCLRTMHDRLNVCVLNLRAKWPRLLRSMQEKRISESEFGRRPSTNDEGWAWPTKLLTKKTTALALSR